ncbi:neural Wiskott-Aldrich syndrome protein-like [Cimex lectularius]|uniref:Wiskott-Aldrich syndrome protein n=1 Tax=Cimex lectularius TaxID=79782 RepID=A0A8I6RDD0_CIMLE|nr:neural Wiskott-Aldrich syndrome protein-like [Cimex lectularius]
MASSTSESKRSSLLTYEENDIIFSILGVKCTALATTVAELYFSRGRYGNDWQFKDFGVLCLVKDNCKKSYFFRLYCPLRKKLLWEHEVYNNLTYLMLSPYLYAFEAEDYITGFNFADEEEGAQLKAILMHKLEWKRHKKERKREHNNNVGGTRKPPEPNGYFPPAIDTTTSSAMPLIGKRISFQGTKKKLTKEDIGIPLHFRHISHVGWDPDRGFDLNNLQDPELIAFFKKAGVSEHDLKDKATQLFIYDFIIQNGGLEAVKEDNVVKTSTHARGKAPPPPPSRAPPTTPPPPPPAPPIRTLPPRIMPPSAKPAAVPPPAPPVPPPPPDPLPPVADSSADSSPRSALMQAIKIGTTLKPVSGLTTESKKQSDSRGELMEMIRQGVELKSVSTSLNTSQPPPQPTELNSLAGALARALAERSKAIYSDSSDSSDEEEEEEAEWE